MCCNVVLVWCEVGVGMSRVLMLWFGILSVGCWVRGVVIDVRILVFWVCGLACVWFGM